jgi:hypothetical protein
VAKALVKLNEILDIELPPRSNPDFARMMSTQKDASVAIINSGLKADENRFRKRQTDVLRNLYERMQAAEQKKGVLIEQHS